MKNLLWMGGMVREKIRDVVKELSVLAEEMRLTGINARDGAVYFAYLRLVKIINELLPFLDKETAELIRRRLEV